MANVSSAHSYLYIILKPIGQQHNEQSKIG